MVRLLALCLATGLIVAPCAPGAAGAEPTDAQPRAHANPTADEILHQLSTGDWRQRQETIRRLVELGPGAQPFLRELAARNLDREARKNIELAARRIDEARLFGPSLITLHVADATPGEVFADLARQCAGPLPTWPEKLWDEPNWPKLTLDYDRRPFWDVMSDLRKRLQIDCITPESPEIRIARDSGHDPGGSCVSGAFLVTADAMTFRNGMNVVVCVYGEPKVTITRAASFTLEKAEDDQGHPLLPQTSRRFFGRRFRTGSRQLPMLFQRPADDATRIGRLKGTLNVFVQTASEVWEIPDPASMSATTRLIDSVPVTIESFTASRSGGQGYELLVTLPITSSSRGTQDEISDFIRKRLTVLDANGCKLSLGMVDTRGTNDGAEITADFTPAPQPDGNRTGPPAKLVWDIPLQTRQRAVPFDFKSIPINDPFN
jgi:hypothetical protein